MPTIEELRKKNEEYVKNRRRRSRTPKPAQDTGRKDHGRCAKCGGRLTSFDAEAGRDDCGSCLYTCNREEYDRQIAELRTQRGEDL